MAAWTSRRSVDIAGSKGALSDEIHKQALPICTHTVQEVFEVNGFVASGQNIEVKIRGWQYGKPLPLNRKALSCIFADISCKSHVPCSQYLFPSSF